MQPFNLFQPKTIDEALDVLQRHRGKAKVLAGGTNLLQEINERKISPENVVSLKSIPDLAYIKQEGDVIKIGATTLVRNISDSAILREKVFALSEAAGQLGTPQTRNLATIGGNLGWASPAGDLITPLVALGATVKIVNPKDERVVPVEDIFVDVNKTSLNADDILTEISIETSELHGSAFSKVGAKKAMTISWVNVAVALGIDKGNICKNVRVALGSVAPTVIRSQKAEEHLRGKPLDEVTAATAASFVREEIKPITDKRATAWYRTELSEVLTRRTVEEAAKRVLARRVGLGE